MNPRNKLIKEKPNLQSVADVNITDEHSSLDELSVDKENYFTETFPIDDEEKFKTFKQNNSKRKTIGYISKIKKPTTWNTLFSAVLKPAITNTQCVSLKEIEIRLNSVLQDFEETSNYRKKFENSEHVAKEKKNFLPSLLGKFNKYKFMNENSRNSKKTSSVSFLKGIKNKSSMKNRLTKNNTETKATINPDEGLKKTSSDKLQFNNLNSSASKLGLNQKKIDEKDKKDNTAKSTDGRNQEVKRDMGVSNFFAKSTLFISIVQDYLSNQLIEKFKKKVNTFDQEKEVMKYFKIHERNNNTKIVVPLEHFFHFDRIKEDIEIAKGLRNFFSRNKIYDYDFLVNNLITKYKGKMEKDK